MENQRERIAKLKNETTKNVDKEISSLEWAQRAGYSPENERYIPVYDFSSSGGSIYGGKVNPYDENEEMMKIKKWNQ